MSEEKYFMFYFGEDGISCSVYTKEELQKELDSYDEEELENINFFDKLPDDFMCYDPHTYAIIKGEIIIPKVKEVVKKIDIGD